MEIRNMDFAYVEGQFKKIVQSKGINKIAQTQFALRSTEIVHRLTYEKRYNRMEQAMERFRKCNNKKPRSQIKREIILCKKFWKCYPLHYYRHNLYRKDNELSERELLNYIPEFFFYYLFLPFHDSKKFENLLTDKNLTEQLFRNHNIPQAHTICKLIDNHIYTNNLIEKNFDDVKQELVENKYQKIFVKPLTGLGGHGIYIFNRNASGQYVNKDENMLDESFLNKICSRDNYIMESGLEQTPEFSEIYPYSVNTFRIITENKGGTVRILHAILRFGRSGNEIDNTSKGGIFLNINIRTGGLATYAISHQCESFMGHPDTNFVFKGNRILNWAEIRDFVTENAMKLPLFTYLAWDIASTKKGPVVIEANPKFGLDGHQLVSGGLREIFRINDPRFYWINKGKRI